MVRVTRKLRRLLNGSTAFKLMLAGCFLAPLDLYRAGGLGSFADLALLSAFGATLLAWGLGKGRRPRLAPQQRLIIGATLFLAAGLFGTFVSPDASASLLNAFRFAVATIILPVTLSLINPTRDETRRLTWAFVLGVSASAVVSFASVSETGGRSPGLSNHPNYLGATSAFALILVLALWRSSRRNARIHAAFVALLAGGVYNSGSRAAIIGVVAGGSVYLLLTKRVKWVVIGGTALLLVLGSINFGLWDPPNRSAVGRLFDPTSAVELSNNARAEVRSEALARFDQHWVTGSGFADAAQAHTLYFQIGDVGGLLGIAAYGLMFGWGILARFWRRRRDLMIVGYLSVTIAYLVAGLASNAMWDRWVWVPLAIGLSANGAAGPPVGSPDDVVVERVDRVPL